MEAYFGTALPHLSEDERNMRVSFSMWRVLCVANFYLRSDWSRLLLNVSYSVISYFILKTVLHRVSFFLHGAFSGAGRVAKETEFECIKLT